MIYKVKGFSVVNEAEIDVFSGILLLFYDPTDVGNLIPDSFAFSKSSLYIWKYVKWVQLCGSLNILWHCLSLGMEWKLTFYSPVATTEFSKFAGILSAAL